MYSALPPITWSGPGWRWIGGSDNAATLGLDPSAPSSDAPGSGQNNVYPLGLALGVIGEGEPAEAEQILYQYLRDIGGDYTSQMMTRRDICQLFGLANAASAAVDCLRAGIAEPSLVWRSS